jgi:O-antigen/teichoic acid export membrane protein
MSRTARAFRATLVFSGFGYAAQALSLVAIPLFLSTVGIDSYGLMVTVMAFTGYLNFADAGLSWGSVILIAQAHGRGSREEIAHVVRHSMILAAGSGLLVLGAVGALLALGRVGVRLPMFAHHPESDLLVAIAALQLVLTMQVGSFNSVFFGLQQAYWPGFYQGIGRLLGLGGSMFAAWRTHSIAAVMGFQLASTVVCGAAAAVHAWRANPWAFARGSWRDGSQYRAQFRVGAKTFVLQIGRTVGYTAPTLGISSILGPAMVPFYTVPTTLLGLFFTPINSWNSNMQSAYGEAWTAGALDWIRAAFRRSLEKTLLVGGLGMALFAGLGDAFIRLWTHDRLSAGTPMIMSVCAIVTASCLVYAGEFLLAGLNRHRGAALAEFASGLLALALVPAAVGRLGIGAVGIGAVGAVLVTSAWVLYRQIRSTLGGDCFPSVSYVARFLVALSAGIAGTVWVQGPLGGLSVPAAILHLVLEAIVGSVAYGIAAAVLRLVVLEDAVAIQRRIFGSPALSPP